MRFTAAAVFALLTVVQCEGQIHDDKAAALGDQSRRTNRFSNNGGGNGNIGNGNNGNVNNGNGSGSGSGNGNGNNDLLPDEVRLLIKYKDEQGKSDIARFGRDGKIDLLMPRQRLASIRTNRNENAVKNALHNNPHIERIEKDEEVYLLGWPDRNWDETASRRLVEETPYGITMVQAEQLWDIPGAAPIKVCVVDTGYGLGHPDLPNESHGVDGWFDPLEDHGVWNIDGHGHGSHCAGTIGAVGSNNEGVVGVNPDPTKFSFFIGKGLGDSGSGSTINVLNAVQHCADSGAKVISMSLGGGGFTASAEEVYANVTNHGVLLIAAAGNGGNSAYSYPASYKHVMSVAAVDSYMIKAGFSQWNDQVEIAGPGVGVKSTITDSGGSVFTYASWSGTSMATPHVAGVAALVWSHFPSCTNNQIRNVLTRTSLDRGDIGCDDSYGFGIVQAKAAYDLLDSEGCSAGGAVLTPLSASSVGGCAQDPDYTPPPTAAPTPFDCDQVVFQLDLLTDRYPSETSWDVKDSSDNIVAQVSQGQYESETLYNEMRCLPPSLYTFTIYDSWGDGICCGYGIGSYTLQWNGQVVDSGGVFGSSESVEFGSIPASPPPPLSTPQPTDAPSNSTPESSEPSASPTSLPSSEPSKSSEPSDFPSAEPSSGPTGSPTDSPIASPTKAPTVEWAQEFSDNFETGWQHFADGGGDAFRTSSYAYSGSYSLEIRDNSGEASSITTEEDIVVSSYSVLRVKFCYRAQSMDNSNEDFWLQTSTDGGSWTTVKAWAKDIDFNNGQWYVDETVEINLEGNPSKVGLRFRCDASGNKDHIYIDDVTVDGKLLAPATSAPTSESPTTSPSSTPSDDPSEKPTVSQHPSDLPSSSPSSYPSADPTKAPTDSPTDAPTKRPTASPTDSPTDAPTDVPSEAPSKPLTSEPSESPSKSPTKSPTTSPTNEPSNLPSEMPSDVPSLSPSTSPTKTPTTSPTDDPSSLPSEMPSDVPSDSPSESPTRSPTNVPTDSPSDVPSESLVPTSSPTVSPTRAPTDAPTNAPTNAPTMAPTDAPTNAPTNAPTKSPTVAQTATWIEIFSNDFETGWQDFEDGGGDAHFNTVGTYANSGTNSLRIRDNSATSYVFSDDFPISSYSELRVDFKYYPRSMDNSNENFLLEYSTNKGGSWTTVKSWAKGANFENNQWYSDSVQFEITPIGASDVRIRFLCDASSNWDWVYIDDVELWGKS